MTAYEADCKRAADLFKLGHTTWMVARLMQRPEPKVVRMLDDERSKRLKQPPVQYDWWSAGQAA